MSERRTFDTGPLRGLFFVAAVVLFVLAALGHGYLLPWGMVAFAAAHLF